MKSEIKPEGNNHWSPEGGILPEDAFYHKIDPVSSTSISVQFSPTQFSHSVMSDSATPCTAACQASLSITNSRNLLKLMPIESWCHPTISSSVGPFSSHLQPCPASGSFPMSQLFTSGVQSIGVSASTSVLPVNTQGWSPSEWTGWISLQSRGLSRVFSNTTVQMHQFFGAHSPTLTSIHDHWKNHSLD